MLYNLKNLKKTYDQRTVLSLDGLRLEKDRVLGLLGPNGAGKTTLLDILAFLTRPSSGEIWFEKEKVAFSGSKLMELRRRVVLVEQQPILFTTTVSMNVEFPLKIRNTPKVERERAVGELLELVGMEMFRNAIGHRLSGGETQRIAIARALACSPEVILLDEPTASVDVENQVTIERIIRDINRTRGISVIFTTHNMLQASRLADETVFLFDGKVAQSIYENIFSGRVEMAANGSTNCVLQNGLKMSVRSQKMGPVRISIDPGSIKFAQGKNDSPTENTFRGRLSQLSDEGSKVRALVDVGIPVSILIPRDEFKTLQLSVGEAVEITCPEEGIEVF